VVGRQVGDGALAPGVRRGTAVSKSQVAHGMAREPLLIPLALVSGAAPVPSGSLAGRATVDDATTPAPELPLRSSLNDGHAKATVWYISWGIVK